MLTQVSRDKVQHTNEHTYFFYGHGAYFWRQPPVVIKLVLLCYLVSGLVSNWWASVEVIALLFCLQAFSDEFQKKFPSASSGSTSSTQNKGRQHCLICSCYIMLPNKRSKHSKQYKQNKKWMYFCLFSKKCNKTVSTNICTNCNNKLYYLSIS